MTMSGTTRLAVTMGDPRGIGPEICAQVLANGELEDGVGVTVVGASKVMQAAAGNMKLQLDPPILSADARELPGTGIGVMDLDNFSPGELDPREPCARSGQASLEYIEKAVELATSGRADAVVTGPINKEAIAAAGSKYPGHTEMLADLTGGGRPVMLLLSEELMVAFVTTHVALRDVPESLSIGKISHTIRTLHEGLRSYFGLSTPRIAVCGLNPHCGDGGRFGTEEADIVEPAVQKVRDSGMKVAGPMPSDTVFSSVVRDFYDGFVALYHDQGMIPIKFCGIQAVTNVTLGLPIIRTSVGHGTAYDIAGKGSADGASMLRAIRAAARMVRASRYGAV